MKIDFIKKNIYPIFIRDFALRLAAGAAGGALNSLRIISELISGSDYIGIGHVILYSTLGGIIGGLIGFTPILAFFFGMLTGPYFGVEGEPFEGKDWLAVFLLITTLIILLRSIVALVKRFYDLDLLKGTIASTLVVVTVGVFLFFVLHSIFIPSLWDKVISNIIL